MMTPQNHTPLSTDNAKAEGRNTLRFAKKCLAIAALATLALSGMLVITGCSQGKSDTSTMQAANASFKGDDLVDKPQTSTNTNTNTNVDASAQNSSATATPGVTSKSAAMTAAEAAVTNLVADYGTKVAVAVVPLDGSLGFSINGDKSFVSASMIKLLILTEYMAEVDAGQIDGSENYTLTSDDIVGGTGILQGQGAGTTLSYDELARDMIAYSDNTATNVLIDKLGMTAINARASILGLSATDLQRYMMQLNSGVENHISANDAAAILKGFANHTIASDVSCSKAEVYLMAQSDSNGLEQGLPSGVAFGHKTGDLTSIRHDGGIVYADNPYVIVVLTELGSTQGNALMAQISSVVYNTLEG